MRGGTSKAVFFHENHLPRKPEIRDVVIQAAYGSPDPNRRQIDQQGLVPDFEVLITDEDRNLGHDTQLERALEVLLTGD